MNVARPFHSKKDLINDSYVRNKIPVALTNSNLTLPTNIQFRNEFPKHRNIEIAHSVQGVTHDNNSWYICNQWNILKIPASLPLNHDYLQRSNESNSSIGVFSAGIPKPLREAGYHHFCDIDFHNGFLYAPLEHPDKANKPALIVIFNTKLQYIGHAQLHLQNAFAPWCAINPGNGLLYSSSSNFKQAEAVELFVYRPFVDETNSVVRLTYLGNFFLKDKKGGNVRIKKINGGTFSPNGHLYLVSDTKDGGIFCFDMITGRNISHREVNYSKALMQELEGITYWDLDSVTNHDNIRHQLHLLMLDMDDLFNRDLDEFYLKHFEVSYG